MPRTAREKAGGVVAATGYQDCQYDKMKAKRSEELNHL
jgi:hypothetical protein